MALMSYCPLAQAGTLREGILNNPVLKEIAKKYNATVEQVMLAWNIRDGHTIAIPRSGRAEHTLLNAQAEGCIQCLWSLYDKEPGLPGSFCLPGSATVLPYHQYQSWKRPIL